MFTKNELNYLLVAINSAPVGNTNDARNKATMMLKLSDLMDSPAGEPPAGEPPKATVKPPKKTARKK